MWIRRRSASRQLRVALIERVVAARLRGVGDAGAERGAAVADVVLGAGEHAASARSRFGALQPAHRGLAELGHQRRVLAEALVRAAPALVARHGHARRERPVDAGRADFGAVSAADLLDQLRVARGAQADVVRKDHGADHVAVAVHGVDAVEERDLQARLEGMGLDVLVHRAPVLDGVGLRIRIAAAQHRPEEVLLDVGPVLDEQLIGLGHLADLLVERHLREKGLGLGVERQQLRLRRHGSGLGRDDRGEQQGQRCRGQGKCTRTHTRISGGKGTRAHGRVLCTVRPAEAPKARRRAATETASAIAALIPTPR